MRTSTGFILIASLCTAVLYNNCGGVHERNSALSSVEACNLILKDEFNRGYHPFLKNQCASCHVFQGTGNGAFADQDANVAFNAFVVRGNNLVGNRALDPQHQPPFSGTQHTDTIAELNSTWDAIQTQVDLCIASSGGGGEQIDEGIVPEDPVPTQGTVTTFVKLLEASATNRTLTWNLETELRSPRGLSFPGAQLQIDVQATTTVSGGKSYIFSNPRVRAGTDSLHLMYIGFIINNELVQDATSYHVINRRIPAGQTRDAGAGSIAIAYDIRATDTIALTFGLLEEIDFNPPTFAQLIEPTGVFGRACLSCHDGSVAGSFPDGGFDISSREAVLRTLHVAPYSPNNSEIFIRMNDAARPMPSTGILPEADLRQVLWWIQDGAR